MNMAEIGKVKHSNTHNDEDSYKSFFKCSDPLISVTVEMNMGKRRLIEFLLSPLLRYKDESVRER